MPPEEREARAELGPDHCVIDGEHFFVRGVIELPVLDPPETFAWGVWASLSEKSFRRAMELWDREGKENEPPYFGWLCTALPGYPDTLFPKTTVHERPVGLRSLIAPEPTERSLAVEQRGGITRGHGREIAETVLHPES